MDLLGGLQVLVGAVSSPSPGCQFCPSFGSCNTPPVVSALASTLMVSLFLSCVYVPSASTPLLLHILPSGSMVEIVLINYSGNCIIGNVILKLK